MNVTLPLQFHHLGPPFPTLLRPVGHSQNSLKFWLVGWLVDRSVGRSWGSHTNVMLPLQFRHPGPPFPTHLHPAGHPKTALNFGRLVGWSVTGKSHECHAAYSVSSPGPALPNPSTPCAPPQNDLKFWSSGQSVSRSIGRSRGSHTNDMLPL